MVLAYLEGRIFPAYLLFLCISISIRLLRVHLQTLIQDATHVFSFCCFFLRFISFCRVDTGLSDEECNELVTKLKPYLREKSQSVLELCISLASCSKFTSSLVQFIYAEA